MDETTGREAESNAAVAGDDISMLEQCANGGSVVQGTRHIRCNILPTPEAGMGR